MSQSGVYESQQVMLSPLSRSGPLRVPLPITPLSQAAPVRPTRTSAQPCIPLYGPHWSKIAHAHEHSLRIFGHYAANTRLVVLGRRGQYTQQKSASAGSVLLFEVHLM